MKKLFTTVILLGMLLPSVCAKTDKDKFSGYLLSTSRDSGSSSHITADCQTEQDTADLSLQNPCTTIRTEPYAVFHLLLKE